MEQGLLGSMINLTVGEDEEARESFAESAIL